MRETIDDTLNYANPALSRPGVKTGKWAAVACVVMWLAAPLAFLIGLLIYGMVSRLEGLLWLGGSTILGVVGWLSLRLSVSSEYGR